MYTELEPGVRTHNSAATATSCKEAEYTLHELKLESVDDRNNRTLTTLHVETDNPHIMLHVSSALDQVGWMMDR